MVCPTCFCTTVEDHSDLSGTSARTRAEVGFLLHHGFLLYPWRQRAQNAAFALSAMDDPQACDLDRPVRHVGLRRLRPLHHLVPGRASTSRRGGRDQGNAAAADGGTAWRDLKQILQRAPVLRRRSPRSSSGSSPAARATIGSMPANICFTRASLPTNSFSIRHGKVALEIIAPGRAADRLRDCRRRRYRRRLLAYSALSLDVRCARRRADARHRHRCRMPARQMRGGPRSRLRDDEALPAVAGRSGCMRPGCRSSMSMASTDSADAAALPIRSCRKSIGSQRVSRELPDTVTLELKPLAGRDRRSSPGSSTCSMPSASAKWRSA